MLPRSWSTQVHSDLSFSVPLSAFLADGMVKEVQGKDEQ